MNKKLQALLNELIEAMSEDLANPDVRSPALYKEIRGLLLEHGEDLDKIPKANADALESEIRAKMPKTKVLH